MYIVVNKIIKIQIIRPFTAVRADLINRKISLKSRYIFVVARATVILRPGQKTGASVKKTKKNLRNHPSVATKNSQLHNAPCREERGAAHSYRHSTSTPGCAARRSVGCIRISSRCTRVVRDDYPRNIASTRYSRIILTA